MAGRRCRHAAPELVASSARGRGLGPDVQRDVEAYKRKYLADFLGYRGLYDSADDAEWYRTEYERLGDEIAALKALPERKQGKSPMFTAPPPPDAAT